MFEGKVQSADTAQPFDNGGGAHLRPVTWRDLVARFDAVRELRVELGTGETGEVASFDPDSARHIAELAGSKRDINFDDLANGKDADGMGRPNSNGASSDDPRT
jgi:hypothetical protein